MAKGKRNIVLEYKGKQVLGNDLDKKIYSHLKKNYNIKYSDSISSYLNLEEGVIYSVVNEETYKSPMSILE